MIRRSFAILLLFSFAGCERGCLTSWIEDRGGVPATRGLPAPTGKRGPVTSGVDCSDGLARCTGGMVEVSRAYHYPDPCNGSPERCTCPWERVDECPRGCVADGVEEVLPRELAATQLCAPASMASVARAPADGSVAPASCDGEAYFCRGSAIIACGPPNRIVATCVRGCAREGQALDDDDLSSEAAVAILCRREGSILEE